MAAARRSHLYNHPSHLRNLVLEMEQGVTEDFKPGRETPDAADLRGRGAFRRGCTEPEHTQGRFGRTTLPDPAGPVDGRLRAEPLQVRGGADLARDDRPGFTPNLVSKSRARRH